MRLRDVVILGGGLAGLTAALKLKHLNLEVLDAASWIGGRTRSQRLPGGPWLNFGAQYITEDRPAVVELADSLGVEPIHSEMFEDYYKLLLPEDAPTRAEVEAGIRRIEEAQSQPRPMASPELDDVSFADWLGPMSEAAADYFDRITLLMNCASTVDLSVVGGLWVWGEQRTSPWNTDDIPHHDRGELVVAGGTSELARALVHPAPRPRGAGGGGRHQRAGQGAGERVRRPRLATHAGDGGPRGWRRLRGQRDRSGWRAHPARPAGGLRAARDRGGARLPRPARPG